MLEHGFIMLPRSILNWQWYDEPITMRVFLHLLLTANYLDRMWHGIEVKRGQRVCTYAGLSSELKLSVQQIRTAVTHLETSGELSRTTTSRYSLVTINNYNELLGPAPEKAGEYQGISQLGSTSAAYFSPTVNKPWTF